MELKGQFSQELMTVCDSQRANTARKEKRKLQCAKITLGLSERPHIELLSSGATFNGTEQRGDTLT